MGNSKIKEGYLLKRGTTHRIFIYLLCFSFLLLTGGLSMMAAGATERGLPIGEMISRGEVTFEARENVWKPVEPSHFPLFHGVRMRTGKGQAIIVLPNESQIEVGGNSFFSFQHNGQFCLMQGGVSFRIPASAEMSFTAGMLTIGRDHPLEAARGPVVSSRGEEAVGSIALHSNGSVTVESIRGSLSVLNQERVVLAAISPGDSVTIPSASVSGEQRLMVAQVGEPGTGGAVTRGLLGLNETMWVGISFAAIVAAGGTTAYSTSSDFIKDEVFLIPQCP